MQQLQQAGIKRYTSAIVIFLLTVLFLPSCSPVRHLGPDKYLLNKNKVRSDKPELNESITTILKQKPNRKILGLFRFHLGVYTLANTGKETKFKRWVKRTIGEEPIVLDSVLTKRSNSQITQFMKNEGYFNAVVTDTTIYKSRKKANVIYTIQSGQPYLIGKLEYSISDPVVKQIVFTDTSNCVIKKGNNFSTKEFSEERDRITLLLRNMGYYEFNSSYIAYDVDTAFNAFRADVFLNIAGTDETVTNEDSCCTGNHKIYRIHRIYVQTDYDPLSKKTIRTNDAIEYKNYYFVSDLPKPNFKYDALIPHIFIEKDNLFKVNNSDFTYRSLSGLGTFRFVNIRYEILSNDTLPGEWLSSYIQLSPAPKQDYKLEVEGTHNGGNFGLGGSLVYRNKNSFRGAELIEVGLRVKVERIPDFVEQTSNSPFNSIELGPDISLRIPRMLWPVSKLNKSRSANPVTVFRAQYNYQQRPEYIRHLMVFSTGFEFRETKYKRHFVYPAEINYSNFNISQAFRNKLNERNDIRLEQYYTNKLITNGRYAFVYNTQEHNSLRDFWFFRFSFEVAGNSVRLFDKLFKPVYYDTTSYNVLGINYSQYVLPEVDLRFYHVLDEHNSIVYRLHSGIGIAYLNSKSMPYEKTYFAGGSNDLRAFRVRTVGPGSYNASEFNERVGEIKINFNAEVRSDIFKFLEGAAFLDAGNVWLRKEDPSQPGGQFQIKNVVEELALGTGLGIRLDLNFFIIRLDAGVPLRDPSKKPSDRWVIQNYKLSDTVLNFGIGYPF